MSLMQDVPPNLALLVRALWNIDLRMRSLPASVSVSTSGRAVLDRCAGTRPSLHLPGSIAKDPQMSLWQAAALHAAAHLQFSHEPIDRAGLKPIQQTILGLLEDARVEWLAMQALPGLLSFWLPFHVADAGDGNTLDALLKRLSRALIDPAYADPHPWVIKACSLFFPGMKSPRELRQLASLLGNDIGQMRLRFDAASYAIYPAYRDDNSHLWLTEAKATDTVSPVQLEREQLHAASRSDEQPSVPHENLQQGQPSDSSVTTEETVPAQMLPSAKDASEDTAGGGACLVDVVPEWDRLCRRYRPAWCSIFVEPPSESDPSGLVQCLAASSSWINWCGTRLRSASAASRRMIRANDGGDLCDKALIEAGIALRAAREPDQRIFLKPEAHNRGLHVSFILDTSISTGAANVSALLSAQGTLLDAMKAAVALSCAALEKAGHTCSIISFSSNTRHCIRVQTVKHCGEPIHAESVLARLAGLVSGWSTRTGAVLRHVMKPAKHACGRSLIVLVTDGEPHDVDIHDPLYLREDLYRAAEEARRSGMALLSIELGKTHQGSDQSRAGLRVQTGSLGDLTNALAQGIRIAR